MADEMVEKMPSVMVVEDEFVTAAGIKATLTGLGYEVGSIVARGEDVLDLARREKPDIVLMDVQLAGKMDGIQAAQELNSELSVPVIFLTAFDDPDLVDRAKLIGPFAYLVKPVNSREFGIAIDVALYHDRTEKELASHRERLEDLVADRTQELVQAYQELELEIAEHKRARGALQDRESALERQTKKLQEANISLKYLLQQREEDKRELGQRVVANVKELVLPHLDKVMQSNIGPENQDRLELMGANLREILAPFAQHLSSKLIGLTHSELQVADLVRNGKTNKEMAELLNISSKTVEFHRENIRKKLDLTNQKVNLRSYLQTMPS